jgi:Domain of unknown function (DUF4260)
LSRARDIFRRTFVSTKQRNMKNTIKLEEFAMAGIAIYYLTTLHVGINQWWYILLFFAPDISMLGYLFGKKAGAISYNLFHHKLFAIAFLVGGILLQNNYLLLTGILLFGHSSFDRIMGYGLKYFDGFKHTHLGMMK